MKKQTYTVEYSLQGSVEIEADSAEEATEIFNEQYEWNELVYMADVRQIDDIYAVGGEE